jgi:hypothetical protein
MRFSHFCSTSSRCCHCPLCQACILPLLLNDIVTASQMRRTCPDQRTCPLKLLTTQKSRQPGSPSAASLSRMNRRGTVLPPIFRQLTHITNLHRRMLAASCAKLPQESFRFVLWIERIGNRYKTFKQGWLPCRWGDSNPRCTPECSTVIDTSSFVAYCLFDHRVHYTELAVHGRGIGRGKSTDYQTFDDNGLKTKHF